MVTLNLPQPIRTPVPSWDGTSLSVLDYGGVGRLTVLLHGLAGHAGEWTEVASRMTSETHKVAFDQRGHGQSSRRPSGVSRADYVADVVELINHFSQGQGPVNLVGQSLGGHTAMLVAARHPPLVARLVMVEATPDGPSSESIERARRWFARWPRPLASEEAAIEFFGPTAPAWLAGMERREDGWWPCFDDDVMLATMGEASGEWLDDWAVVGCPTLLVRGGEGWMTEDLSDLESSGPSLRMVTVPGAGHDVQLDAPRRLAELINEDLRSETA
ncbi:MAG TPA: alpha/beta hydrolase [Candidatus Dormibacteraeota bacterium]|nr:alpha/beta hydrolase [Candidatus Dormibacteraeota bacterium]